MLITAALLAFLIGIAHSVLGERYILIRLFRRGNLPRIFGDDWFTRRTMRFAWHLTTAAWWGFAIMLLVLAGDQVDLRQTVLLTISAVFFLSSLMAAGFSHGKHFAWPVFLAISVLSALHIWN